MTRSLFAVIALAASSLFFGGLAADAATQQQKSFKATLLASDGVSDEVKQLLRDNAAFVGPGAQFVDFTGEGRGDAVIAVTTGGVEGYIAFYVLSAKSAKTLKVIYAREKGFRLLAQVVAGTTPQLIISAPVYNPGDQFCCASYLSVRTLEWNKKSQAFKTVKKARGKARVTAN